MNRMPRRGRPPVLAAMLLLLLPAAPAFAYIDPGTGSALFYVVTGVVVSLYFGIRGLYYSAVEFVFRVRHRDQRCNVAIHCEDPRYEITFLPVMRALRDRGVDLTYFTMYERDGSYEPLPAGVTHKAVAPGMIGYAHLNHVEARLLVTTTPQLDVMTFRRSRRVRHYAHLQHALGESRFVRPFAYDYYDSILCCGPIMKANVRRMEALRGSRPKQLFETGIPHYEELLRARGTAPDPDGDAVVLIAPSWGPLSMFEAFGTGFVRDIARHFRVIVRPHPQMKQSQPALYREILGLEGVTVDTGRTPAEAMSRAHVLLSDISGISHEFAFIHERPVVVVDRKATEGGLEGELLGGDSELKARCAEFIVPVQPSEMPNIAGHLSRAIAAHSRDHLTKVRSELVYHFGAASGVAADQIVEILRQVDAESLATGARRESRLRQLFVGTRG